MRLCFYTDTFFPLVGGAEMVLHRLCVRLRRQGDFVLVVAPAIRGGTEKGGETEYPVDRYRKPFSRVWGVHWILPRLMMLHRRHRFELIHCHALYPQGYVACALRKRLGLPVAVRPHGSDVVPNGRMRGHPTIERRIQKRLPQMDAFIAQGSYLKDVLLDMGADASKIHVIHNGVETEEFRQRREPIHPRPYILGLGNLIPRKGFDVLLRAYARLSNPRLDLIIAGDGPQRGSLEAMAVELNISKRVVWAGFVDGDAKIAFYQGAEFFVCPSRKEPFANVALEAMAAGLPVVASSVDGNLELIREGVNGLLFESEDEERLARRLHQLSQDSALNRRLRSGARERIRAFDWSVVASQYRELYGRLIRETAPPKQRLR